MARYDLELDGGNTALKYRLVGDIEGRGRIVDAGWQQCFDELFERYGLPGITRFSAVWSDDRKEQLKSLLHGLGAVVQEVVVVQGYKGLQLAYCEPSRFGVDRWLAMLAARELCPSQPLLVVDCGTAVTLDYLRADGVHQGGYIVPGLDLCVDALGQQTDRVGSDGLDSSSLAFGRNTAEAVHHGAQMQICALIERSLSLHCHPETRLLLTGGDAGIIANGLRGQPGYVTELLPELVLDGLKVALPN